MSVCHSWIAATNQQIADADFFKQKKRRTPLFGNAFKKLLLILAVLALLLGGGAGVLFGVIPALHYDVWRAEPDAMPEASALPEQTPTPQPTETPEPTATP